MRRAPTGDKEIMKGLPRGRHVQEVEPEHPGVIKQDTAQTHDERVDRFRHLYDASYDDLWRYCLRRSPDRAAAEDTLSDTFAVAWQKLDDAPTGADGRPWLFAIARNHLRNRWRKERSSLRLLDRLKSMPTAVPSDPAMLAADNSAAVAAALGQLKEQDRELLRLAAWEELSHREIAESLGCSENAVAIRLHRARERFAEALKKTRKVPLRPNRLSVQEQPGQKGTSHA